VHDFFHQQKITKRKKMLYIMNDDERFVADYKLSLSSSKGNLKPLVLESIEEEVQ